jgi:hypothetical protein
VHPAHDSVKAFLTPAQCVSASGTIARCTVGYPSALTVHVFVQLLMNVPFTAVHFSAYETAKRLLAAEDDEGLFVQLIAGGAAGGLSAAVTNPLDVVKTRLQTDGTLRQHRGVGSSSVVRFSTLCIFHKPSAARERMPCEHLTSTWRLPCSCRHWPLKY